jgi:cytochrome bd-type quinol oxidase subunit 1
MPRLAHRLSLIAGYAAAAAAVGTGLWILAANTWNDSGVWVDGETWND